MRDFDVKRAWSEAMQNGTAMCRGGCGDPPTLMRFYGRNAGCWCRGCWAEVSRGVIPPLDPPKRRRW